MWTLTSTAPQRQTTRGKTCCFCDAYPEPKFRPPQPQNGRRGPKNLISIPLCFFVRFNDRAADGRKKSAKLRWIDILKNYAFCDVHFSSSEKQILETRCKKTTCILVDPLGVSIDFLCTPTSIFLTSQKKGRLKPRRGLEIWLPHRNFDHPDLPRGPFRPKKGAKREAIPSSERRNGPRASRPLCTTKTPRHFKLSIPVRGAPERQWLALRQQVRQAVEALQSRDASGIIL